LNDGIMFWWASVPTFRYLKCDVTGRGPGADNYSFQANSMLSSVTWRRPGSPKRRQIKHGVIT